MGNKKVGMFNKRYSNRSKRVYTTKEVNLSAIPNHRCCTGAVPIPTKACTSVFTKPVTAGGYCGGGLLSKSTVRSKLNKRLYK
jgi:hypothetical protein